MKNINNLVNFIRLSFKNISYKEYIYAIALYLMIAAPIFLIWNIAEILILGYRNPNVRDSKIFLVLTFAIFTYVYLKLDYKTFKSLINRKRDKKR